MAGLIDLSASEAFPDTLVGHTSATVKTATLKNPNKVALTVYSVTPSGDFGTVSDTCSGAILGPVGSVSPPLPSCTVGVTFTPTAQGTRTGSLQILSNAKNGPATIALLGTGTLSAPTFSPTSLAFGAQALGTAYAAKSVTITNPNLGPIDFTGTAAVTSGYNIVTDTCSGNIIGAGNTCTIGITFTPAATGSDPGTLSIYDNAATGTQKLGLAGTGSLIAPTFSPKPLAFGKETVGLPNTLPITVTNPNAVSLGFISATIPAGGVYTVTGDTCSGNSIGAGGTCTISVTFTPTSKIAFSATLSVVDDAGTGTPPATTTQVVSLTGTGN
jgi:hypothetical protein